ncbi:conserved hypothetical protein [Sporisorium reilianum SRZ2]|uniref:Alpha-ketoglutarate-dependent dioxygenase AlkB-like domain-containing protein n=1 Tax=Sporisorium reilianum (strain SRZ2) TaxID=999809 RepID=E6ZK17_SPORE|nr:conserved hypothetical protein [Sporisorium reilianum SRZ2]
MASGPIIWSETRQELCESLAYYRAYQTGSYVASNLGKPPSTSETKLDREAAVLKDSIPYGYLLAGWPSRRDAWAHNGKVIISHGGGKSEVDDAAPGSTASASKASLKQDQSASDSIIRALLHSSRHRLPIVLIAADSYALLPFKLACSYAVLGWYIITDCWAERESDGGGSGFVRWKFRFEWIPAQGQPWWELPAASPGQTWNPRERIETFTEAQRQLVKQMKGKQKSSATSSRSVSPLSDSSPSKELDEDARYRLLYGPLPTTPKLVSTVTAALNSSTPCNTSNAATCITCKSPSPLVFDIGFMCLRPECPSFFLHPSSNNHPNESTLTFSPTFLQPQGDRLNDAFPSGAPPFPLIPTRPSSRSMDQARGLWCRRCGRLSCREVIFQPRCAHCGHRVGKWKPLPTIQPPVLARGPFDFSSAASEFDPVVSASSGIVLSVRREEGLVMYTFEFPAMFGDCRVHLVQADVEAGGTEDEADGIFEEFQRLAWPADAEASEAAASGSATEEGHGSARKALKPEPAHTPLMSSSDEHVVGGDHASPSPHTPRHAQLIPFRRHMLKQHASGSGRMLTQQFTCNYGVAYKHVVAMGTQPLTASSPTCILSTLTLLHTRTRRVVPDAHTFNELYPVLYLAHQKMGFHDDGEPGLGAVVASLSLGATCRMKFRLKPKFHPTFARVAARDRTVLDLPLRHGAVVVQQGHDLQHFFEHSVSPDAFRIAVTARRIDAGENDRPPPRKRTKRCSATTSSSS